MRKRRQISLPTAASCTTVRTCKIGIANLNRQPRPVVFPARHRIVELRKGVLINTILGLALIALVVTGIVALAALP